MTQMRRNTAARPAIAGRAAIDSAYWTFVIVCATLSATGFGSGA